ncbi:MAG: GyrI-like domain-containing protein [Anaerolineaceae bacterium]|nr:GyrI-like domain-containing protein [Anaerolineaceae bacterium]MBN2676951.1 GyrI-like domain-containing protein [Anaerolineaceae bacterium]
MYTSCEIKEFPDRPILSVRTHAAVQDLPQVLGDIYGRIMAYLGEQKTEPTGMPFVIYYNMDMSNLDIKVGFEAPTGLAGNADIQPGTIPAGRVVSMVYTGPYEECGSAYEAITKWMKDNNLTGNGTAIEFYLNDPRVDPPAQTRIEMPIM